MMRQAAMKRRQAGVKNCFIHARQQVRTKETAGRAEKMYLDIDTYYIILLDDHTQVNARNVPEPLGDPGRDVTSIRSLDCRERRAFAPARM